MYYDSMNWIDDRIQQSHDENTRKRKINDESPRTFDALWAIMQVDIEHANAKLGPGHITVEGNASTRDVRLLVKTVSKGKQIRFSLNLDKHAILVDSKALFNLDVCPNGTVCLKDETGDVIELHKASEVILGPLLFPAFYTKR
jgi:hypothetical protein